MPGASPRCERVRSWMRYAWRATSRHGSGCSRWSSAGASRAGRWRSWSAPAALPLDRKQRVFGFAQVAEAAVERLPLDGARLGGGPGGGHQRLHRLAPRPVGAGVRAARHRASPVERPADSIRMLLLMHQQLTSTWEVDLQAEALAALPAERRAFLQPTVTAEDVLVLPDATPAPAPSTSVLLTRSAAPPPARHVPAELERRRSAGGAGHPARATRRRRALPRWEATPGWSPGRTPPGASRCWPTTPTSDSPPPRSGTRCGSSCWGETGQVVRWVQGVALPGLPGIVIFQNDRLAIGFTNTGTDVADLYREPAVAERVERIAVKDGPTDVLTVQLGKHGPMVKPGLALHWAALDPSTLRLPVEAMMLATDWASLNAGADRFLGPAQNVMYADAAGHIGWRVTGVLPLRAAGDDGTDARWTATDGRHDWSGYLPVEQMPRVLDPPSGRIVTANQRAIGTSVGRTWPASWASPTRARRITELLQGEGLDARRMRALQLDTVGTVHREVVERLRPLPRPEARRGFRRAGTDGPTRTPPSSAPRTRSAGWRTRRWSTVLLPGHVGARHRVRLVQRRRHAAHRAAGLARGLAPGGAGRSRRRAPHGGPGGAARRARPGGSGTASDIAHPFGRSGGPARPPLQSPIARARRLRPVRPGGDAALRAEHADGGGLRRPGGDHPGPAAGGLRTSRKRPSSRTRCDDWLDGDLDGTRTRLHAPPVGPPLVFRP